jgi:xylitol oxidase
VWLKDRTDRPGSGIDLGRVADAPVHMLAGGDRASLTPQLGEPGPWHERLPHFAAAGTPSRGAELQTEYLVPRPQAVEAIERLRALAPQLAHVLQVSEIRTVAADDLWLSPAHGTDVVGLHFTWVLDTPRVRRVVALLEEALLPLGARPHWGKVLGEGAASVAAYDRLPDFAALTARLDPDQTFANDFLRRYGAVQG